MEKTDVEELLNRLDGVEMSWAELGAYNYLIDWLELPRTGSLEESRLVGLCVDLLRERYP